MLELCDLFDQAWRAGYSVAWNQDTNIEIVVDLVSGIVGSKTEVSD